MPGLIERQLAQEIVLFVGRANPEDAFGREAGEAGDEVEVEPALLSLVCRELNERRLALGLDRITPDLLAGNRDSIIQSFYEATLADQPPALRAFVEDELLGDSGFRESVSLERARRVLAAAGVPAAALDTLVARRLLRVEERLDVARVEIIHDVLTHVIRASRDTRHLRQAEADAAARERELRRARRRTQLAYGAVAVMGLLLVATAGLGWMAWQSSREADRQRVIAEQQRQFAESEKTRADQALALATQTANGLVFDLAQKFRNSGVPAAIIADILARARELLDQLSAAGQSTPALRRSQAAALVDTSFTLLTVGDTKGALATARQAHDLFASLFAATPDSTDYQYGVLISDDRVGDALVAQGDLPGALAAYRDELAISKALTEKDSTNTSWQRSLSVADNKVGDVLRSQGDLAGALAAYREGLATIKSLADKAPDNDQWQYDIGISNERIGNVQFVQGDLPAALQSYKIKQEIVRRLAEKEAGNTYWQRDLAVADEKVGDVLRAQSDLPGALAAYRECLAIRQKLILNDPGNTEWQRDLAVADEKIGDVLREQDKTADALPSYREAFDIISALAKKDPGNALWQIGLSIIDERLGSASLALGDPAAALTDFENSEAIVESLKGLHQIASTTAPDLPSLRDQLIATLRALVVQKLNAADAPGALAAAREEVAVARRIYAAAAPDAADAKTGLAQALGSLSWELILNKRTQEALDSAMESLKLDPTLLFVQMNRAHALLLLGHFDEASAIYVANKDKKFDNGKVFADIVRDDFALLRKLGIDTPDMKRIEALLAS
jgi:tetratricopeptide (TPR) repeat protein